jgi:6-phosphogluconate dehydrogenase
MRYLSAMKNERVAAASKYQIQKNISPIEKQQLISVCKKSFRFASLISYAQGLQLLSVASANYKYEINIADVIRIWKGGCIIRSVLLNDLQKAYQQEAGLTNIIQSPVFKTTLGELRKDTATLTGIASGACLPVAVLSASLNYFDAYCSVQLPANLIQAQRDFFGAHTYERIDKPGPFHTNWN